MEQVSLLKAESYQSDVKQKIVELLEPLGGLGTFCKSGDRVLIKPNFILPRSPESAATTHPAVILAVVSLLKDMGCHVAIGDSPGMGSAEAVIRKLGIYDALKQYRAELVEFRTPAAVSASQRLPFEPRFKNLLLAKEVFDYDRVINLPKLKSHGQMGITLATKNLYGCLPGPAKGQWHFAAGRDLKTFARLLVEIAFTVNPVLHILDGIVGMDGNGPSNGRPREFQLLAASSNPIALDRMIVEIIRHKPEKFPIFEAATELKLPGVQLDEIQPLGTDPALCVIDDFQVPSLGPPNWVGNKPLTILVEHLISRRLILKRKVCIHCRKCEQYCPAKAIIYRRGIRINESKCIKCCCCQELCPVGALEVADPWLIRWFGRRR
ncbi:MAG TPA: DUF362 domain-containing protein [Bacillota bacterium]|nr:DUF362 domain-containing protein [Bacillota bacterium]HPT87677.1 DUF362 domain-containing protein [Bacillota bacterium]